VVTAKRGCEGVAKKTPLQNPTPEKKLPGNPRGKDDRGSQEEEGEEIPGTISNRGPRRRLEKGTGIFENCL